MWPANTTYRSRISERWPTTSGALEACDREGAWTALTYILSDWGEGIIVLIRHGSDIDPAFLHLCSETPESH